MRLIYIGRTAVYQASIRFYLPVEKEQEKKLTYTEKKSSQIVKSAISC